MQNITFETDADGIALITFDMPGDWTVRFHFFENCDDAPADSPHGHAAFLVYVPDPSGNADGAAGN